LQSTSRSMPEQSIIVWHLETVPDLAAAARLFDMGGASDAEVREVLGSGFPKHPLHKIACIVHWSRADSRTAGARMPWARPTPETDPRLS
jgi:hypothetical protein